jgi:hypothetical protein
MARHGKILMLDCKGLQRLAVGAAAIVFGRLTLRCW